MNNYLKKLGMIAGLLFSSTVLIAANSETATTIPDLYSIAVTGNDSGQTADLARFYANNVELEPVYINLCFKPGTSTDVVNAVNPTEFSYSILQGGSGSGTPESVTLNNNEANMYGIYLYSPYESYEPDGKGNSGDQTYYYEVYNKSGFTPNGGVAQGTQLSTQDTKYSELSSKRLTFSCTGPTKQLTVYMRRKVHYLGYLNVKVTANDGQISSDPSTFNFESIAPISYDRDDFNDTVNKGGEETAFQDGYDGYRLVHIQSHRSFNFAYEDPTSTHFITCYPTPANWNYLRDSSLYISSMACHLHPRPPAAMNEPRPSLEKDIMHLMAPEEIVYYRVDMTGISIKPSDSTKIRAPLQALEMTRHYEDGYQSGWLSCPDHRTTNHWFLQNEWNLYSYTPNTHGPATAVNGHTVQGGVGITSIPTVGGKNTYIVETALRHYSNGSQNSYDCDGNHPMQMRGYDFYGNGFNMSLMPGIGSSSNGIRSVTPL